MHARVNTRESLHAPYEISVNFSTTELATIGQLFLLIYIGGLLDHP